MKRHKAQITTTVDGMALSIASLIFMGGDVREMAENAVLMAHAPWTVVAGNAVQLRDMADQLDVWMSAMATSYATEGGMTVEQAKALMADGADHYFDATQALAALSIWYDDPSLGLEESQRLEDLLGQLAGTVIYSQQDLLLPPHVVAAGETLPAIAMPLRVSWQLLGKINGVDDPQRLMPGEHLKLIRGPFDAVVSVSRRRISLQLAGNFAGSFPVVVGRQFLARVGSSIPVAELRHGSGRDMQAAALAGADAAAKPAIVLADGLVIEAAEDPGMASDTSPATSLVVSVRDLAELLDILGPGSSVLIRQ
jgi:hypothetical protein